MSYSASRPGTLIISGWVNRNEVREREGFNPEPGLDTFVEPLNVQPVGASPPAVKPVAKAPAPGFEAEADDQAEKNALRKAIVSS